MKKIGLGLSILFLAGCASTSDYKRPVFVYNPPAKPTAQTPKTESVSDDSNGSIDEIALKKFLGLDIEPQSLGYRERSFNTCDVGFGYSKSKNCRQQHMVLIQFRLQCRDSEGTVSRVLSSEDLQPISRKEVRWNLPGQKGVTETDSEGYAQILAIAPGSQRSQRLKLAKGNDFLYLRAGEITQIVTPRDWCSW